MARGKKNKGGFLKMLGIEAEKAPSEEETGKAERQAKIVLAWKYLRDRIDRGVSEYLQTGNSQALQEYVARPAQDTLIAHLDGLRGSGVSWAQPDRPTQTSPEYEVVSEQLNSKGQPTAFVIRETFSDYSILRAANGQERQADGGKRSIQAKVEVEGGQHFRLLEVIEVKGKTI
jgi:hypothetical protein